MKKNILLNSDTSYLDLDHQSDWLFFQIPLYSAIRNYGGHSQWAIKMSRSHCLEQLFSCILTVIYVKAKKRRMWQCFREGHALYWKKMWFFCLLPVGVCIDVYVMIRSYVLCVCPLINYTLATEENVPNVRVCACCNHFPITWNKFYRNTQLETISNIRTRYIFQRENIGNFTDLHNEKNSIWKLRLNGTVVVTGTRVNIYKIS